MGMTISGTMTYGKPLVASLATMPSVAIAFSQAVIDKTYLTWLDVNKLLIAFPEHVKLVDDTVTFQGPVAIISSLSHTQRRYGVCMLGLAFGVITYISIKAMRQKRINHMVSYNANQSKRAKTIYSAAIALLSAGFGFYLAGRILPTQPGIYFLGQPPFYV